MTKQRVEYTDSFDADSSAIQSVFYNKLSHDLYIVFNNGNVSGYSGFPEVQYIRFEDSESKGAFYNRSIAGSATLGHIGSNLDVWFDSAAPSNDEIEPFKSVSPVQDSVGTEYAVTTIVTASSWDNAAAMVPGKVVRIRKNA